MEDSQYYSYITVRIRYYKKEQINDMQLKFETDNNKKYKVEGI